MAISPVFHGAVDDEGHLAVSEAVRGVMTRYLATLKGKPVDIVIRVHRKQRTDRQSRYYFGVVVPLLAEHCGYEKDEMHELLAMRFLRMADDPITGSPRRKHTPQTDTKEFSEYVDACIRFAAELGVYVPAPGEVAA